MNDLNMVRLFQDFRGQWTPNLACWVGQGSPRSWNLGELRAAFGGAGNAGDQVLPVAGRCRDWEVRVWLTTRNPCSWAVQ